VGLFLFIFDPLLFTKPTFFVGVIMIFTMAGLATLQPSAAISRWSILFPAVDIIAIYLLSFDSASQLLSILYLLPLSWIASMASAVVTTVSSVFVTALLIMSTLLNSTAPTNDQQLWLYLFPLVCLVLTISINNSKQIIQSKGILLARQLERLHQALDRERHQQQSLDFVLNTIDIAIIRLDRTGQTILANHAHRALVSRFGAHQGGDVIASLYHLDRVTPYDDWDHPLNRALRGVSADREIVWVGAPDSEQRALLINVRCFFDTAGLPDGAILASTEITEEMSAGKLREDFIVTVSHEIRNPLTSIIGNLDLVLDDASLADDLRRRLVTASDNSLRILEMTTGLLDNVSSENSVVRLEMKPTNVVELVQAAADSIRPAAELRGITVHVADEHPFVLDLDEIKARQIFSNLMSNAVKYNVEGGFVRVTIRRVAAKTSSDSSVLSVASNYVELRVTDSGRGIPFSEQKNLFQRFYRAKSVRGSSIHGTGLGLHISRDLIRRMGGDLRIESIENSGTSAVCTFPLHPLQREPHSLSPQVSQLVIGENRAG